MNILKYKIRSFLKNRGVSIHRTEIGGLTSFMKKHFGDKEITGIEIGVEYGTNSLALLEKFNLKRLYLIDPYETYNSYKEKHRTKKTMHSAEKFAKKLLKKYNNKIIWIKKKSDEAFKEIRERVDFVYIDGNHAYEFVKRDIENYFPLIKEGGIMAGDDFRTQSKRAGRESYGVIEAVLEKFKLNELQIEGESWWVIKGEKNDSKKDNYKRDRKIW